MNKICGGWHRRGMICPTKPITKRQPKHWVDEVLDELGEAEIEIELLESDDDVARWNKLIRKHHYLKEHQLVGESLRYVAKQNGEWIALIGWSSCAFHLRARDAWIGWNEHQRKARRSLVACNARFVILKPKSSSPGLASQILSRNLRRLSSDWQKRYGHPIALVETFVDPERFEGTCYRAANWTEIGVTKGFGRSRLEFYQIHAKPKAIFVYRLVPEACEILCAPEMPPGWAPYERIAKPMEYPLSGRQTKSLLNALQEGLTDPRRYKRGRVHRKVSSIVAIATAAIIAGNNSYIDIGEFSRSLNQNQLRGLRASRDRKTKKYIAPSESTIRRVIQRLDSDELDKVVTQWLRSHLQDLGIAQLVIDGKCARTASKINGQTIQLFSALDTQTRLVTRQIQIPSKTNEISALKDLLDPLDIRGALVSADAIQTQKKSAQYIVEQKQADFLVVVKANQPNLFKNSPSFPKRRKAFFFPPDITLDQGHGRHETREVYPLEVTPEMVDFPHVAQAAVIVRTTHHLKSVRVTEEIEIALTSRSHAKLDAAGFQAARRAHWGIENPIHYVRDVTFGEDRSTICKKDAPRTMAALRNLVIGICALDGARKGKSASYLPRFRVCSKINSDFVSGRSCSSRLEESNACRLHFAV